MKPTILWQEPGPDFLKYNNVWLQNHRGSASEEQWNHLFCLGGLTSYAGNACQLQTTRLEHWEQNLSRCVQNCFKINVTLLRRLKKKKIQPVKCSESKLKKSLHALETHCATQPAQQAQSGNGRSCCKSGPRYLSRVVWEARPGVAGV